MWTALCRLCSAQYAGRGLLPSVCPTCAQEAIWTIWTTVGPFSPRSHWELTDWEQQFLRSLKIDPEESRAS